MFGQQAPTFGHGLFPEEFDHAQGPDLFDRVALLLAAATLHAGIQGMLVLRRHRDLLEVERAGQLHSARGIIGLIAEPRSGGAVAEEPGMIHFLNVIAVADLALAAQGIVLTILRKDFASFGQIFLHL